MINKIRITLSNGRVINGEASEREIARLIDRMSSKKIWTVTIGDNEEKMDLTVRVKDVYSVEIL